MSLVCILLRYGTIRYDTRGDPTQTARRQKKRWNVYPPIIWAGWDGFFFLWSVLSVSNILSINFHGQGRSIKTPFINWKVSNGVAFLMVYLLHIYKLILDCELTGRRCGCDLELRTKAEWERDRIIIIRIRIMQAYFFYRDKRVQMQIISADGIIKHTINE